MSNKTVLAFGADIKNRFLVGVGKRIYYGPPLGDLSDVKNYELFEKEINKAIKKFKPNVIAYDLHPNYFSSRLAKEINQLSTINYRLPIQHHHAHIASVMYEHKIKTHVIGVSFDGTGYGDDGNMWGGEFLLVKKGSFRRLAHLKYRMMPGGEKVVHQPWRMVLSILKNKGAAYIKGVSNTDKNLILKMMGKNINSPLSSSAGRLFDAAAALLGVCTHASHEAEGPIKLERLCNGMIDKTYDFSIQKNKDSYIIDTDKLFLGMLNDIKKHKSREETATKFHNSIASIIINMSKKLSKEYKIKDIMLSGGVFQNKFLMSRLVKGFGNSGLNIFTNKETVSDINISLGQYYVSGSTCKN